MFHIYLADVGVPEWKREYFKSCNKFIMAETLSPTFVGMEFKEVADICYTKLNLLLLAMEARKYEGGNIYINPKNKIINPNAIGLFITVSADAVKRAWFYCRKCHANIRNENQVSKCQCKRTAVRLEKDYRKGSRIRRKNKMADEFMRQQVEILREDDKTKRLSNAGHITDLERGPDDVRQRRGDRPKEAPNYGSGTNKNSAPASGEFEQSKMKYDSTGMFHWCPSRDLNESLMDRQEAAMTVLQVRFNGVVFVLILTTVQSKWNVHKTVGLSHNLKIKPFISCN